MVKTHFRIFSPLLLLGFSQSVLAQTTAFTNLNFNFQEAAFAANPGSLGPSVGYNLINDTTGAKLTALNGDQPDVFISVSRTLPTNAVGAEADALFTLGMTSGAQGLRSVHGFSNSFAGTYPGGSANNPGTLIKQTIRFTFANHLAITNFTTNFSSLNTAGRTWEHAQLAYLKPDGSYFSPEPMFGDYLSWSAATNPLPSWHLGSEGVGNGASGSPSTGWFVAASTATILNVPSNLTTGGSNGSKENLTATNGNSFLDYNDVNLPAGTQIGGFEWTILLEDTRGQDNNASNWTATQTEFNISGVSSIPEPGGPALLLVAIITGMVHRKR